MDFDLGYAQTCAFDSLARPETIEVMALLPDSPPRTFKWRGQRRRVLQADGPERVSGTIQREGEVLQLIARSLHDLTPELSEIDRMGGLPHPHLSRADEFVHGPKGSPSHRSKTPTCSGLEISTKVKIHRVAFPTKPGSIAEKLNSRKIRLNGLTSPKSREAD